MNRPVLTAIAFAFGWLCTIAWADPAHAERRVALVIGNSAYQHAPALPNPVRDAKAVAAMFQQAGFDVVSAEFDLGNLQLKRAMRQFEDDAADADIAVVYYAGHGIEIHGVNYLIPIDAKLASDRDADDEAITMDRLVGTVEGAKRLRLVILDACRDNPFARTMKRQRTIAVRGVNAGLGAAESGGINTLIAYAAKAGSAAEDGEAEHSPFTTALLKDLFVPGLDLRLAFGRVRDDVLKITGQRQEPFVYGSLGAETIALVPAPVQPAAKPASPQTAATDLEGEKSDYNLVDKIGTDVTNPIEIRRRAYEIFLRQHPAGFYSDIARQRIDILTLAAPAGPAAPNNPPQPTLAALEPNKPPPSPGPSTAEQQAWDKIKDSGDPTAFRGFIKHYPSSPFITNAQTHLDALARAAQEREAELKRQEGERAAQLAEAKRQAAEAARLKAEQAAALKRAQDEAKAAEAARLKAEREAALKLQEEARQAKLAETAHAKQQADTDAARQKADQEAALKRAQDAAKAAEQARLQAELDATLKRQEEDRQKQAAAAARAEQDAACKREQDRLTSLQAAGSTARNDLKQLEQGLTCEKLRPLVVAALEQASTTPGANTSEQIRAAQQQLTRLGCFAGPVDGSLNDTTKAAVRHYQEERGQPAGADVAINDAMVSELKLQSARVCPLVCPAGKVAAGEQCVAEKPQQPPPVARHEEEEKSSARRKAKNEEKPAAHRHEEAKAAAHPQPRVRQEASSGGGGHAGTTIGVGF